MRVNTALAGTVQSCRMKLKYNKDAGLTNNFQERTDPKWELCPEHSVGPNGKPSVSNNRKL